MDSVLSERGIAWKQVAAFGDGLNDLELLQTAGTAVAMDNGVAQLCAAADLVAPDAAQDGAARVIEEFFL